MNGLSTPHFGASQVERQFLRRSDGRVIGAVERRRLVKRVDARKHKLRHPPGWCLDRKALDRAAHLGARAVELEDVRTGERWVAPLAAFSTCGQPLDRGHGLQVLLEDRHWLHFPAPAKSVPLQLPLFGEAAP